MLYEVITKETAKARDRNRTAEELKNENQLLKEKLLDSNSKQKSFEVELNVLKQKELKRAENELKQKLEDFYNKEIFKWRKRSWIEFAISIIVFV